MENLRGRKMRMDNLVFEELVPCSAWSEDSSFHYLLVDLPGFKKEEIKLQVDEHGRVVVTGERQTKNNKIVYFKETVNVPENSDIGKINGKYEGEVLYVIVPKRVEEKEENKHDAVAANLAEKKQTDEVEKLDKETSNIMEETHARRAIKDSKITTMEGFRRRWSRESGLLKSTTEIVRKNKAVVVTALLAFSLGVLLSHSFRSTNDSDGSICMNQDITQCYNSASKCGRYIEA